MSDVMRTPIEANCPECNVVMRITLDGVRLERSVTCPNGHQVKLVDQGGGARSFGRSMADFDRTIADLNKKLKIRF